MGGEVDFGETALTPRDFLQFRAGFGVNFVRSVSFLSPSPSPGPSVSVGKPGNAICNADGTGPPLSRDPPPAVVPVLEGLRGGRGDPSAVFWAGACFFFIN